MTNQLMADNSVLSYKLDAIRSHIRKRLETVNGSAVGELNFILNIIERWETMPAGWKLTEPFVPETNKPTELQNKE